MLSKAQAATHSLPLSLNRILLAYLTLPLLFLGYAFTLFVALLTQTSFGSGEVIQRSDMFPYLAIAGIMTLGMASVTRFVLRASWLIVAIVLFLGFCYILFSSFTT